ncbi:MAG: class I poly(R)-hydroxyalkanoic acid synthase, partial [Kangiellaceae bacterium]|nr:class I poly(R)-hydroxyalkanoic acid synthase [Kangiellaceae bacterium]
ATTAAYLAAIGDNRIATTTYFATLLDFTHQGDIGVFINDKTLTAIENAMEKQGVFDGRAMAVTFNLLRENELYWNYFVNNYLKGEKPSAFDLLYWSSDSTNIPAALHKFVLRELYFHNNLVKPGSISINNTPINLQDIKSSAYFVSPRLDHIAKWESTYLGAKNHGKKTRFIMGESGHIAGIINPPSKGKYDHWVNENDFPAKPDQWLKNAKRVKGSWWNDWQDWILKLNDGKVEARIPGEGKLKVIEDAPGSYVKQRIDPL